MLLQYPSVVHNFHWNCDFGSAFRRHWFNIRSDFTKINVPIPVFYGEAEVLVQKQAQQSTKPIHVGTFSKFNCTNASQSDANCDLVLRTGCEHIFTFLFPLMKKVFAIPNSRLKLFFALVCKTSGKFLLTGYEIIY